MAIVLEIKNLNEPDDIQKIEINRRIVIGSSMYCDIVLKDKLVSTLQCEVAPHKSGHIIAKNLDLKKEVFINSLRLKRSPITLLDRVRIGAYEIKIIDSLLTDQERENLNTDFEEFV